MTHDYDDFDVHLRPHKDEGKHWIEVTCPQGDDSAVVDLGDLLQSESANIAVQIARSSLARGGGDLHPEDFQRFGRQLFDRLLPGRLSDLYVETRAVAEKQERGTRLRLRIQDPLAARLPWELLNSRRNDFLCLSSLTPVVRFPTVPRPVKALRAQLPLRVLAVMSNSTEHPLNLEEEKEKMEAAFARLREGDVLNVVWLKQQTPDGLREALSDFDPHILHLAGHGEFNEAAGEGMIVLQDDNRRSVRMPARDLSLLIQGTKSLRLVFLNSCEGAREGGKSLSSTASQLVSAGVPAVIAMQFEISDSVAIRFAHAVYRRLCSNQPIDTAVTEGRRAIKLSNSFEWSTPVLFLRTSDTVLFEFEASAPNSAVKSPPTFGENVLPTPPALGASSVRPSSPSPQGVSPGIAARPPSLTDSSNTDVFRFWSRRLQSLTGPDGGTRWELADPSSDDQVWTTAQTLVALSSAARAGLDASEFSFWSSLEYIERNRNTGPEAGGYGLWCGDTNCFTDIAAWVILARAHCLNLLPENNRADAKALLARDIAAILPRQTETGGWSPVSSATRRNARVYTTSMCIWALLEAVDVAGEHAGAVGGVITKSAQWLRSVYEPSMKGWTFTPPRKTRALSVTALTVYVLSRVERGRFGKALQGDPKIQALKATFLADQSFAARDVDDDDRLDSYDTILQGFPGTTEASRILWLPAVTLAFSELARSMPRDTRADANLRVCVQQLNDSGEPLETYVVAERLIASSEALMALSGRERL